MSERTTGQMSVDAVGPDEGARQVRGDVRAGDVAGRMSDGVDRVGDVAGRMSDGVDRAGDAAATAFAGVGKATDVGTSVSGHDSWAAVGEVADEVVQRRINDYWSGRADSYDAHHLTQVSNAEIWQGWAAVWRGVLPPPPARVLDVGTGTGHVSVMLAELGYDVVGIDLSVGMLERAKAKLAGLDRRPTLELGDAIEPDFLPESFDVVTSRYVLWTLRTPHVAVRNWRQLVRPGGVVAVVDSTWFPGGQRPSGRGDTDTPDDSSQERPGTFDELYDERVMSALPLAKADSIEATAATMRAAGLADVVVEPLHEILDLDRRFGVAPGHDVQMQFLISGRRA